MILIKVGEQPKDQADTVRSADLILTDAAVAVNHLSAVMTLTVTHVTGNNTPVLVASAMPRTLQH